MSDTTIITLPLDRVHVGQRLRPVDAGYVAQIAESMRETGQHTPIDVGPAEADGRHPLIAGAHRCAAAALAGLPHLLARVFEGNEDERKLREIDENLLRRELSALDRAVFLAQRKVVYERIFPHTAWGKAPKGKTEENFRFVPGRESFAVETARRLGVSDRQVRTYLTRAVLAPELREQLALTRWANHGATLDALAKAAPAMRAQLVAALTRAESPARTLAAALLEIEPRRAALESLDEQQARKLVAPWRKASKRARDMAMGELLQDRALRAFVEQLLAARETAQDRVLRALPGSEAA